MSVELHVPLPAWPAILGAVLFMFLVEPLDTVGHILNVKRSGLIHLKCCAS